MPLPKIDAPIFELILPSTNQPIKYRPFLVKEQKILMLAMEGDDDKGITTAIKQIINNCAIDKIDVDKLPTFDLEYFFTRLRAKSIGEKVELRMRHPNGKNKDGEECSHETVVNVDLLEIKVIKKDNHEDKILLDESRGIGVKMRYPRMDTIDGASDAKSQMEAATFAIIDAIEYIYDKDDIYKREDQTKEEILDFIDNLSQAQFEKLANFFDTMPKLKHTVKWKCKGCGKPEEATLEGMSSFFVF
jgi:T4 bacteriophage base plate protein